MNTISKHTISHIYYMDAEINYPITILRIHVQIAHLQRTPPSAKMKPKEAISLNHKNIAPDFTGKLLQICEV